MIGTREKENRRGRTKREESEALILLQLRTRMILKKRGHICTWLQSMKILKTAI